MNQSHEDKMDTNLLFATAGVLAAVMGIVLGAIVAYAYERSIWRR